MVWGVGVGGLGLVWGLGVWGVGLGFPRQCSSPSRKKGLGLGLGLGGGGGAGGCWFLERSFAHGVFFLYNIVAEPCHNNPKVLDFFETPYGLR